MRKAKIKESEKKINNYEGIAEGEEERKREQSNPRKGKEEERR